MTDLSDALRSFGWWSDFPQPHPADVAVFVNSLPIFIRLRHFKLHTFIADAAPW
jgi:hypothetical protein